tara:strand:+ start:242 stop:787 length:546 start_codon:yes stop_codon:yes gene_type:complete
MPKSLKKNKMPKYLKKNKVFNNLTRHWKDRPPLKMCRQKYEHYTVGKEYIFLHEKHELNRAFILMKDCAKTFKICEYCDVLFNFTDCPKHHLKKHCTSVGQLLHRKEDQIAIHEVHDRMRNFFKDKGYLEVNDHGVERTKVIPYNHRIRCGKAKKESKNYQLRTKKIRDLEKIIIESDENI